MHLFQPLAIETPQAINALNALLRGERSAVETYEKVISEFDGDIPRELADCLSSHRMRLKRLTVRIEALHGTPADSSGLWGSFANLIQSGAAWFGRKATIEALAEGEDHCARLYEDHVTKLDYDSQRILGGEFQLEQRTTQAMLQDLQKQNK